MEGKFLAFQTSTSDFQSHFQILECPSLTSIPES